MILIQINTEVFYRYWKSRNTSILPRLGVMSGSPLDGDIFVQITSMNFGYMVNILSVTTLKNK